VKGHTPGGIGVDDGQEKGPEEVNEILDELENSLQKSPLQSLINEAPSSLPRFGVQNIHGSRRNVEIPQSEENVDQEINNGQGNRPSEERVGIVRVRSSLEIVSAENHCFHDEEHPH